jgi:ABC-type multidrug transport system fused ATPase/permease subunit
LALRGGGSGDASAGSASALRGGGSGDASAGSASALRGDTSNHTSNATTVDVRRLWRLARCARWRLISGVALNTASTALSLAVPRVSARLIDASVAGDGAAATAATRQLMAVFAADAVLVALRTDVMVRSGEAIAARTRKAALANLLRQELASEDSGALVGRLAADTAVVRGAADVVVGAARSLAVAFGSTVMLFRVSRPLARLAVAAFPTLFAAAVHRGGDLKRRQARVQDKLGTAAALALTCVQDLRSFRCLGADGRRQRP